MVESVDDLVKNNKKTEEKDRLFEGDKCKWSFVCFSLSEIKSKSECDTYRINTCKTKKTFDYHPHFANVI